MLQVVASSPQDMFIAKDKTGLQNIFTTLTQRIAAASECTAIPHNLVASGATVSLSKDGNVMATTQADASGSFAFNNVSPGTYTLAASVVRNGITYDVFTSGVGGMDIPAPSVTVGQPAGVYSVDASLKTSHPAQLPAVICRVAKRLVAPPQRGGRLASRSSVPSARLTCVWRPSRGRIWHVSAAPSPARFSTNGTRPGP